MCVHAGFTVAPVFGGGGWNVQRGEKATYWMFQSFCLLGFIAVAARGNPGVRRLSPSLAQHV